MQKQILSQAKYYTKQNTRRSIWRRLVRVVACILVFCTTYALILPAIAMEKETICAQEEHVHSQECYAQVTTRDVTHLACSYEALAVHRHTSACYDAEGLLQCGSADYIVHEHSGTCWEEGVLVCLLPEVRQHEHTDACYEQPESHEHTEVCYVAGETLICTEETEGHTHTEECEELVQVCEQTVEPHIHTDDCYSQAECPIPEDETHTHTDACMGKELVCQLTEQPHEHGEDCFVISYICGRSEEPSHVHEQACYEQTLVCDQEETAQSAENAQILACTEEEILLHTHTESCYHSDGIHQTLICGQLEVLCHDHTENCFVSETVAVDTENLTCPLTEEEGHTHTERCYGIWELVCGLEEHTHTEACYPETESAEKAEEEPINMLSYRGADYEVVLRFDEWAGIPSDAELAVTELIGESYREHLERTYDVVGDEGNRTLVQFSGGGETVEIPSVDTAVLSGTIGFARFFDITILVDGEEIEPEDTVEVTIRFDETVEIPKGEKTAVHFAQDGNVEVLNAESSMPMVMRSTEPVQETQSRESEFVFWQDSFSVTGTITLGQDDMQYGGDTKIDWSSAKDTEQRTLVVYATFDGENTDDNRITIQVPHGFRIIEYSATEDTPVISGVAKLTIDPEYKAYIKTSELKPYSLQSDIVGITHSGTWASQYLTGYTYHGTSTESRDRAYGGDIVYTLVPGANYTVRVRVKLEIHQELLSHTVNREELEPIRIITHSGDDEDVSTITVTATEVPVASIISSSAESANILEESDTAGRSEVMSIGVGVKNHTFENILYSYFESAQVSLTYPEGVFLEPDTVTCGVFGYRGNNLITGLQNNEKKEVVPGHLSVLWSEDEKNGGGTITWYMKNGMYWHANADKTFGADFRANTDDTQGKAYHHGNTITGFSIRIDDYCRNGAHRTSGYVTFTRTIISRDGRKNISLYESNATRRDITADFGTEDYDYVLGGFGVYSALAYTDNTFCFENPEGLKVTALNLMGRNARDIVIVTNTGREYFVDGPWVESGDGVLGPAYGGQYSANLLRLKDIDPDIPDDEYIKTCLFTVDLDQYKYYPGRLCGSFVYIGQFQDGDHDGSRTGDVVLRQLWDGTTYEQYLTAKEAGTLDELIYINGSTQKAVTATDHTKIGWNNTGVGVVSTKVVNADKPTSNQTTYEPHTRLKFTTMIASGFNRKTQNMIIDPVLVISLPEGISLDMTSVKAVSPAGILQGAEVELVQYGETRQTEVDGVIWKTYRFGVKPGQELALISPENHWNTGYSMPGQRITATFEANVDAGCPHYDLHLKDVVMWDIRNTGDKADDLGEVTVGGVNGDAEYAAATVTSYANPDVNNFLGHGTAYMVANDDGSFSTQPLLGLNIDLAIKPVASADDPMTANGFATYNGMNSSIVPVIPGEYADVKLTYLAESSPECCKGSVIYVPIPKKGVDYAKYFENINLTSPALNETAAYTKTFGFSMDLTGPVTLNSVSKGSTLWSTFYAVGTLTSNPEDHKNVSAGEVDDWEPVAQNGGGVTWLTEGEVTAQNAWDQVVMMKFVALDDMDADESGMAIMRLRIHSANSETGPALGGTYNYWRGYGKVVTDESILSGDWKYTSIVAATPAVETVVGQIFVDSDGDGLFGDTELGYRSGIYTVQLHKAGGGMDAKTLTVDENGAFALVDADGEPEYLPEGTYTVTVRRNNDPDFHFANTEYGSSIGQESPEDAWHNNVTGSDVYATWTFEVTNTGTDGTVVHRVGIGVKATVTATIEGVKTFQGGTLEADAFSFLLKPLDDAPVDETSASNDANGNFSFGTIVYERPGTYTYEITEDASNPRPGIHYDSHTARVTVTVTEDPQTGILSAQVSYDNSGAARDNDRARTDKAAFTNAVSYELPNTGGMGDTLFYLLGGIMALIAVVLLVHRKRRSAP